MLGERGRGAQGMKQDREVRVKDLTRDVASIACIGDGVVGLLIPARHARRYEMGPMWWRDLMRHLARRPALTRAVAAGETAVGLWLATRRP